MNNADRQLLRAIGKNPMPLEVSVPGLAGVMEAMGQELEAIREQQALGGAKLRKPDNSVEKLIDESAPTGFVSHADLPAHAQVIPAIPSGDGKALFRCVCGWESGWVPVYGGSASLDAHIAREQYGYVPESDEAVQP